MNNADLNTLSELITTQLAETQTTIDGLLSGTLRFARPTLQVKSLIQGRRKAAKPRARHQRFLQAQSRVFKNWREV